MTKKTHCSPFVTPNIVACVKWFFQKCQNNDRIGFVEICLLPFLVLRNLLRDFCPSFEPSTSAYRFCSRTFPVTCDGQVRSPLTMDVIAVAFVCSGVRLSFCSISCWLPRRFQPRKFSSASWPTFSLFFSSRRLRHHLLVGLILSPNGSDHGGAGIIATSLFVSNSTRAT